MKQDEQSPNEAKRMEKRKAEDAERLAREQERKKAYLLKEEALEKITKARETKRTEDRAAEEIEQKAKDHVRKEAFFAKEQANAEAQEARKLKEKKDTPQ